MGLRSAFDMLLDSDEPKSGLEDLIWQSLVAGAASNKHPWNLGMFATVTNVGTKGASPKARVVVLRDALPEKRTVDFHTDVRSQKVSELKNQNVAWLFYVPSTQIQLRMEGTATVIDGEEADHWWAKTNLGSRASYLSMETPGVAARGSCPPSTTDRLVTEDESERGRANFRIVRTQIGSVDWLYLRNTGHVRAKIDYGDPSDVVCNWVVP